jgi:hypothetical protein
MEKYMEKWNYDSVNSVMGNRSKETSPISDAELA